MLSCTCVVVGWVFTGPGALCVPGTGVVSLGRAFGVTGSCCCSGGRGFPASSAFFGGRTGAEDPEVGWGPAGGGMGAGDSGGVTGCFCLRTDKYMYIQMNRFTAYQPYFSTLFRSLLRATHTSSTLFFSLDTLPCSLR